MSLFFLKLAKVSALECIYVANICGIGKEDGRLTITWKKKFQIEYLNL